MGTKTEVKSNLKNKLFWIVLAIVLAFLLYHAPRIADSIPLI
jgi:hypothetical protein